jgi:uncharacterized protein YkwD
MRRHLALFTLATVLAPAAVGAASITNAERQVVERSNTFRQSQGLQPVAPEQKLATAARAFAAYMAQTDRYGHDGDGREPSQRAQAQGYEFCFMAENIAMFYSSAGIDAEALAEKFVQGWIDSPGHRRNLLSAEAVDLGVGIAQGPTGRYYAVQMFGRPAKLRLSFSLSNRSRVALRYQLDDKSYALPSGMTRTHEQCTSPALSLALPGDPQPTTWRPANGMQYRIEAVGRGLRVVEGR